MRALLACACLLVVAGCGSPSEEEILDDLSRVPPRAYLIERDELERLSEGAGTELHVSGTQIDAPPYEGALHEMTEHYLYSEHGIASTADDTVQAVLESLPLGQRVSLYTADDRDLGPAIAAVDASPQELLRFHSDHLRMQGYDREVDGTTDVPAIGHAMQAWLRAYPELLGQVGEDEVLAIAWNGDSLGRVLAAIDRAN